MTHQQRKTILIHAVAVLIVINFYTFTVTYIKICTPSQESELSNVVLLYPRKKVRALQTCISF